MAGLVIVNIHIGHGWAFCVSVAITWYYAGVMQFAWRKTRICPVEIMGRVSILSWPRAFRLMYKEWATKMMLLYYPLIFLTIMKLIYLISHLIAWLLIS